MSMPMVTCRVALALLSLLALPALALAQVRSDDAERQPPRLTLGIEAGFTMPSVAYDQWINGELRFAQGDTIAKEHFTTRYVERPQAAPLVRATLRYRPFALLGFYFAYQRSQGRTESTYSGGDAPPEAFNRTLRIQSGEVGMHMQLGRWAQGAGFVDYTVGAAMVHHRLDLSGSHRDRFAAWRGSPPPEDLVWTERTWSGISFAGGVGARVPIGENFGVRLGVNGFIVPFNSSQVQLQESREIGRAMRPPPAFRFPRYTAVYGSARLGVEYVMSRERSRPPILVPEPDWQPEYSAEALAAHALAAAGDTAGALDALRHLIDADPDDPGAWRFLALLLYDLAAADSAYYDEAWTTVQRAIRLNPRDDDLLAAFGRIRAVLHRAGAARALSPPPTLSGISARADADGSVALAWSARNLGDAGYQVTIEIVGPDGERVPTRLVADADAPPGPLLRFERHAPPDGTITERVELRLLTARRGAYSVRVQVRDGSTGESVERVGGFEIR